MTTSEAIPLPIPTNAATTQPQLTLVGTTLTVEYSCEQNDGRVIRAFVRFFEVVTFVYRDNSCFEASDVVGARVMKRSVDAQEIRHTLAERSITLGRQLKPQDEQRFAQYQIFWDDVASILVVASKYEAGLLPSHA